jgi:tRNA-dihydrouridine synthase
MIHAPSYLFPSTSSYALQTFHPPHGDGNPTYDRPLVAQISGSNPSELLKLIQTLQDHVDAIDFNLGCPQTRAVQGGYGAFLCRDVEGRWEVVEECVRVMAGYIRSLHEKVESTPSTLTTSTTTTTTTISSAKGTKLIQWGLWCKIRLIPHSSNPIQKTLEFARMLENAGCSLIILHARFPSEHRRRQGLADLEAVRVLQENLKIPVISNGNVRCLSTVLACLSKSSLKVEGGHGYLNGLKDVLENVGYTRASGVMVGEAILEDPGLFAPLKDITLPQTFKEILSDPETTACFLNSHRHRHHHPSSTSFLFSKKETKSPSPSPFTYDYPFELVRRYLHICRIVDSRAVLLDSVKDHIKNFLRVFPASKSPQFRKALLGFQGSTPRADVWAIRKEEDDVDLGSFERPAEDGGESDVAKEEKVDGEHGKNEMVLMKMRMEGGLERDREWVRENLEGLERVIVEWRPMLEKSLERMLIDKGVI